MQSIAAAVGGATGSWQVNRKNTGIMHAFFIYTFNWLENNAKIYYFNGCGASGKGSCGFSSMLFRINCRTQTKAIIPMPSQAVRMISKYRAGPTELRFNIIP